MQNQTIGEIILCIISIVSTIFIIYLVFQKQKNLKSEMK